MVASANESTTGWRASPSLCTNLGLVCRRQTANYGVACMRPRAHCSPNSIHASEEVVEPSSQAILLSKKTATQTGMSLLGPQCGPSSSPLLASFRQAPLMERQERAAGGTQQQRTRVGAAATTTKWAGIGVPLGAAHDASIPIEWCGGERAAPSDLLECREVAADHPHKWSKARYGVPSSRAVIK